MINNNSTFIKFKKDLISTRNLLGLLKAIPIFQFGFPIVENNKIIVRFPEGCNYDCKLVLNSGQEINLRKSIHWFVFQNVVVESKMGTNIPDGRWWVEAAQRSQLRSAPSHLWSALNVRDYFPGDGFQLAGPVLFGSSYAEDDVPGAGLHELLQAADTLLHWS